MHFFCKRLLLTTSKILTTRTLPRRINNRMAENAASQFNPTISLKTPVQDYQRLIKEKVCTDDIIDDEVMKADYAKIATKMRETIWNLLFSEKNPSEENLRKAGECLRAHKSDACFYVPWDYNEWIPKVRDELLKRDMVDFWRDQIVKYSLGPCWARDSDYFDDTDDESVIDFYRHAGCEPPFSIAKKPKLDDDEDSSDVSIPKSDEDEDDEEDDEDDDDVEGVSPTTPPLTAPPEVISMETPCNDYKAKLEYQLNVDADDEEEFKKIFNEARDVIWKLLFGEDKLSKENYDKAAETLIAYKSDACFYNPWDYNDWIPKVRDELFTRKNFDFWKNVIVEKQLGLCWYKDSDFFDDTEDQRPLEFYKAGEELMKNQ